MAPLALAEELHAGILGPVGAQPPDRSPDGPWVACGWCGAPVLLSLFAGSDDEPATSVAVCRGCHRRVTLSGPRPS